MNADASGSLRDRTGSAPRASVRRRLFARIRASRAGALYRRLDGTNEEDALPWITTFTGERPAGERAAAEPTVGRAAAEPAVEPAELEGAAEHAEAGPAVGHAVATAAARHALPEPAVEPGDPGLVPALHRVADAFERMATSLEVEHREREARLDAVERLLRDLVTGLQPPTSLPPVVVGGSIDLEALRGLRDGAEIDLSYPEPESAESPEPNPS